MRFWRAAGCRPYGNNRKIGAENAEFLHRKTCIACLLTGKLWYRNKSVNIQIFQMITLRSYKIRSRSYILCGTNKPYERAKPIHEIIICGTNKNPANGKRIRSQDSFYFDVKMIKPVFSFSFRRGGNLPPAKNATRFSAIHRALRGYNRGKAAR